MDSPNRRREPRQGTALPCTIAVLALLGFSAGSAPALGGDLEDAEKLFRTGEYEECARHVGEEIAFGTRVERWYLLRIDAERARGKSAAAIAAAEDGLRRFPGSVALRLLARDVYRENGRAEDAARELDTIGALVQRAPQRYATPAGLVALGRYFLLRGADARKVLDQCYDPVTKQAPDFVDGFLATAELALDKGDHALAAETLQKAPKDAATKPRYHELLARTIAPENQGKAEKALGDALKINPHHAESLLLKADLRIDGERYAEAETILKQIFEVNPGEPRAWALRAVLAHLRSDREAEAAARQAALSPWKMNPEVDHLIGRKLSQKYRFAEGSACQRRALAMDADYLPAKIQLCQDLLRLGDETEGWKLADDIFSKDAYNVVAYNLVTLRDRLAGFRTLKDDGFVVRMDPREADLYGERVLALLRRARKTLGERYGVTIPEPVTVEIFPQKKEFAVRTFGLPGADGLLGVCFGRVVTANSPASQGAHPSNWEAVLWHELCHVVTLSKTHNKMPRWLSEGISVHEEERENPAWASPWNPKFRAMILGDELTPLSRLSSAFLTPATPLHLQFAYFESALAVEFLERKVGLTVLKTVLDDLGAGIPLNDTLPRRAKMTLDLLDRDFAQFARERAARIAPTATWEEIDLAADADSTAVTKWLAGHPKSFSGWRRLATRLLAEEKWLEAKDAVENLKSLYPEYVGAENAYVMLATICRRLSDRKGEREALGGLAARNASAAPAYLRLMELDEADGDWRGVAKNARRLMAVNPLIPTAHRALARSAEALGERDESIAAYRALALLDDTDPADVHYHLAKLLRESGKRTEARREVLKALEEAPRFRAAHQLLLDLVENDAPTTPTPPAHAH